MFRQGTSELLKKNPDLVVVAEAKDGQEALELAQRYKPDVVVMDVHMPGLSGVEATRQIHAALPETHILVLTAFDTEEYVVALFQAGASGYLLKTAPISDLVQAIYQVCAGEIPLDQKIMRKLVLRASGINGHGVSAPTLAQPKQLSTAPEALTERETNVLQLLAQGLSNREIAQELSISPRTVQAHLTQLFSKMHVNSRLDAVLTAVRWGWLHLA